LKKNIRFNLILVLFIMVTMVFAAPASAMAQVQYVFYNLNPIGVVGIPMDWVVEIYQADMNSIEYVFFDEYYAQRFEILRMVSLYAEIVDFDDLLLEEVDVEDMKGSLSEYMWTLFMLDVDFEATMIDYNGTNILAFAMPNSFFDGMSAQTIVYLAFIRNGILVTITIIDDYANMRADYEMYDYIIGDSLGLDNASGVMQLIYDSVNN
jgi:hypothetical protein